MFCQQPDLDVQLRAFFHRFRHAVLGNQDECRREEGLKRSCPRVIARAMAPGATATWSADAGAVPGVRCCAQVRSSSPLRHVLATGRNILKRHANHPCKMMSRRYDCRRSTVPVQTCLGNGAPVRAFETHAMCDCSTQFAARNLHPAMRGRVKIPGSRASPISRRRKPAGSPGSADRRRDAG
jgi:hypothetical protein